MTEQKPVGEHEPAEILRKRIIEKFPLAGSFIHEDLATNKNREAFLENEAVREARGATLGSVIEQYLPDDTEFLADMDEEEKLSYIYGQSLEMGEDPDEVLHEFGVTEGSDEI